MPRTHTVGLTDQNGGDAESGVTDLQARTYLGVQPYEQIFGDHHRGVGEHLAQISSGLQINCAVKRIPLRIDCFQRHQ